MEIYCFMNQKQYASMKGKNTGMKFPYFSKLNSKPKTLTSNKISLKA